MLMNRQLILFLDCLVLFAAGCRSGPQPRVEVTHGRDLEQVRSLHKQFLLIEKSGDRVHFKSDGSFIRSSEAFDSSTAQTDFIVGAGESFQDAPDHHASATYSVVDIEPDHVVIAYETRFDHRSFGKNLISVDRGTVSWPYWALEESEAAACRRRAREAYSSGDLQQGIALLDRAIELEPGASLFCERGRIRRDIALRQAAGDGAADPGGRFRQALADFNRALESDPRFVDALLERARIYEQLKEYEKAAADYRQAGSYENSARMHYRLGQYDRSWAALKEQKRRGPVSEELLRKLELATGRKGRF